MVKIKRKFQGIVISDKMDKTIVVKVESVKLHSKYKKRYKTHKKYKVHDEKREAKVGQLVIFEETKPISREKRWQLIKIVK